MAPDIFTVEIDGKQYTINGDTATPAVLEKEVTTGELSQSSQPSSQLFGMKISEILQIATLLVLIILLIVVWRKK
jgi:fatty acid-binding protein DegV